MSRSKQKGTAAETAVKRCLQDEGYDVERRALSGAHDRGDIAGLGDVVVEVKNHKAMSLAPWVDEANVERDNAEAEIGVVWHKRIGRTDPRRWYVSMDGETFLKLLRRWRNVSSLPPVETDTSRGGN